MNDESGAPPAPTSLSGGPVGAADGPAEMGSQGWPGPRAPEASRKILFIAWRDLANRQAGGSEVLVDQLATGLVARGHQVTLLCGGPVAERPYRVQRSGGT